MNLTNGSDDDLGGASSAVQFSLVPRFVSEEPPEAY